MLKSEVDLIPRSVLFGVPERGGCQISPCGRWIAFTAPLNGVMNLWVCECEDDLASSLGQARPLTADQARGVYQFFWAYDGAHLLYLQDKDGDENTHLFAVAASGGESRNLTPFPGVMASMQGMSRKHRDAVLVTLNKRDARFADVFRLTLSTGELELVCENPGYHGFITDDDYRAVLAMEPLPDGGTAVLKWDGGAWEGWQTIPVEDTATTHPALLSRDGRVLHMLDTRGRDTAALVRFNVDDENPQGVIIAQDERADVSGVWTDAITLEPLAWSVIIERRELHLLDERIRSDVEFLDAQGLGEWRIVNRTEDDRIWIVAGSSDVAPSSLYHYVREDEKLTKLYDTRPQLTDAPLAPMHHTTIQSRDGLDLVCYLTLPVGCESTDAELATDTPIPLVLLVHGGPIERDVWGYDAQHQWLANRGYAAISVNFRGSSGFGKSFVAAGYGEWGGKMDDDLVDVVRWAVDLGIADPNRVCIMGGSYGGYATLWAMTQHPELYACGVDIVGPSNLQTLAESIPPYWEAAKALFFQMIGNVDTDEGRERMRRRSPVHYADKIAKPLLIGHGANDPRVKLAESDQMVAAMRRNGVPVTYVLFPDEGHGFGRPANAIRFNEITESFLAKYLGGRAEPIEPGEVEGNTAMILEDSLQ